ncbi:hypothetical protein L8106_17034, partial [Lyngbya sp. PCC 8106]
TSPPPHLPTNQALGQRAQPWGDGVTGRGIFST